VRLARCRHHCHPQRAEDAAADDVPDFCMQQPAQSSNLSARSLGAPETLLPQSNFFRANRQQIVGLDPVVALHVDRGPRLIACLASCTARPRAPPAHFPKGGRRRAAAAGGFAVRPQPASSVVRFWVEGGRMHPSEMTGVVDWYCVEG
jgi:hypothetical protein